MSRFQLPSEEVFRAREKLVLDHFRDEVLQDWDGALSTFPHPHYELIAPMVVHDGDGEVRNYYQDTRVAFPDQHHELIAGLGRRRVRRIPEDPAHDVADVLFGQLVQCSATRSAAGCSHFA